MGQLIDLNPPRTITDADIPPPIARDTEIAEAIAAHVNATDPHLQYATQARGDARYVRQYSQSFRAAPPSSQLMPAGVATKINFGSIISNSGNQFSNGNSRLTAVEKEIWKITTNILFDLPATSRIFLQVYKNGLLYRKILDVNAFTGYWGMAITPADILLTAAEYLELYATIFTSNAKIYGANDLETCWWEGMRVG